MDAFFYTFREAQATGSGHLLATTLIPEPTASTPHQLQAFYESLDSHNVQASIRNQVVSRREDRFKLPKNESNAWVEIYVAYWKTVGYLLAAEAASSTGQDAAAQWIQVYDGWKEVTNHLLRGYLTFNFPAWTIPCLYTTGKYLRAFAIKADEQKERRSGNITFNTGYQDDIIGEYGKHEKLEDAARLINKIFQTCHSDRCGDLLARH
ncbi:MAG: hypothetical protein M1825_000476 [Sarcosagium campestre]|nr:MAG: hypothetical protein M1825_000476 [Sarcosagium campestre]